MDLNAFAQGFREEILSLLDVNGVTAEEAFVDRFCEYLSDNGVVSNVTPSLWQKAGLGIKVSAYSWDPDEHRICLFVAVLDMASDKLKTLGRTEARASFRRVLKFFEYARAGKLSDYIDESCVDVYDLAQMIQEQGEQIHRLDVYLLTNLLYKSNDLIEINVDGIAETSFQVWDIERLFQLVNEMHGIDSLEFNCASEFGETFDVMCVPGSECNDLFDCYVGYIPGTLLAKVYKKYGQRLIERNVRSFLQARGKVNKGIRDTLRTQPEMFMAYNNGISTTAEKVGLTAIDESAQVYRVDTLTGWQIVNGGQTTASLYHAWEEGTDLSGVYVQIKLTVLKTQDEEMNSQLITRISECANTQNKISFSDLGANHNIHVQLEKLSRTVWVPDPLGRKSEKKWYYERARGQYLVDLSRQPTALAKQKFKLQTPKERVITKTQFAKYFMTWHQLPHLVSRGSEANYEEFMKLMERESPVINAEFYKDGIARAIVFTTCDRIVKKLNFPGYKANVVAYTVALLSYALGQQAPMMEIWNHQSVGETLEQYMIQLANIVWDYLTDPSRVGVNTTQWCKRETCWDELKERAQGAVRQIRESPLKFASFASGGSMIAADAASRFHGSAKNKVEKGEDASRRSVPSTEVSPLERKTVQVISKLVSYLLLHGIDVVDKTDSGGALWIVDNGGIAVKATVRQLVQRGYQFKYASAGSKATAYQPGWYWRPDQS